MTNVITAVSFIASSLHRFIASSLHRFIASSLHRFKLNISTFVGIIIGAFFLHTFAFVSPPLVFLFYYLRVK